MKHVKKLVIGGAAAAAAGIALGGAGTANATEGSYLQAVNDAGVLIYDTSAAINTGYGICANLRAGYSYSQEASALMREDNAGYPYTYYTALVQVQAAHNELCPFIWAYKV